MNHAAGLLAYASHCSEAGAALVSPGQTAVSTEQAQHRASNQETKKHEIIVFTFCFYSESQVTSQELAGVGPWVL